MKVQTQKLTWASDGVQAVTVPGDVVSFSIQVAGGVVDWLDDDLTIASAYPLTPDVDRVYNIPAMAGSRLHFSAVTGVVMYIVWLRK